MANQQEMDIAWLAGIVDGEGTITLTKNHGTKHPDWNARKIEFAIVNSDERVILKACEVLDGLGVTPHLECGEPNKHQNLKRWRIDMTKRSDVEKVMEALIPHLTAKREQAVLMLWYVRSRLQREFEYSWDKNDGRKHRCTRRPISSEEKQCSEWLLEFNNPLSRSSTTAREGAKTILHRRMMHRRMIQSGLTGKP